MSYESIRINVEKLEKISDDLAGRSSGKAYDAMLDAKDQLDKIEIILEDYFSGKGADSFRDVISDIKDSERGIRNNLEDFAEKVEKFYTRREGEISIKDRSSVIRVDKDMKDVNNDLSNVYGDIKGVIHGITPHISMGIDIVSEEKRTVIRNMNDRFEATNEIEKTKLIAFETLIDEAKEQALTMEEWYEGDYNEAMNIAKEIIIAGAAAGAAVIVAGMLPFEVGALTVFAVGTGAVTAGKMWKNGNSATGSFVGGTVVGVATFAGGKAINKGLAASAEKKMLLSGRMANISEMSSELAEKYTGNIRSRVINLGLGAEELVLKNSDDFALNKTDEIMKLTDEFIDELQIKSPELEEFLDKTINKGADKLSRFLENAANFDTMFVEGLENGNIGIAAAENVKLEIQNQLHEFVEDNFEMIEAYDDYKKLEEIENKVSDLFDKLVWSLI